MNLILLDPLDANKAEGSTTTTYTLPPNDRRSKHIISHLKKTEGSSVKVGFPDSGEVGLASVGISTSTGAVMLVPLSFSSPPPLPAISLIIGMPHPEAIRRLFPILGSLGLDSGEAVHEGGSDDGAR